MEAAVLDDQRQRDVVVGHPAIGLGRIAMVVGGAGRCQQRHVLRPRKRPPPMVEAQYASRRESTRAAALWRCGHCSSPGRTAFKVSVITGRQVPSRSVRAPAMNRARAAEPTAPYICRKVEWCPETESNFLPSS